jgi:hypothetical protein
MNTSYELAQKYVDFQIPSDVKQAYKAGVRMAGSLNFIKIMMFANEVQLTNDNIDYYMGLPPQRLEDETYEEMRNRGKLAKALLKYRAQLYDYSVYEKQ